MQDLMYLLKVSDAKAGDAVAKKLHMPKAPSHVRLATLAPLSNYGWPTGTEGALVAVRDDGVTIGVDSGADTPRLFVPWQNVSYVGDGAKLAAERGAKK